MKLLKSKNGLKRALKTSVVSLNILALLGVALYDGRALFNPEKYAPKEPEEQVFEIDLTENTNSSDFDYTKE